MLFSAGWMSLNDGSNDWISTLACVSSDRTQAMVIELPAIEFIIRIRLTENMYHWLSADLCSAVRGYSILLNFTHKATKRNAHCTFTKYLSHDFPIGIRSTQFTWMSERGDSIQEYTWIATWILNYMRIFQRSVTIQEVQFCSPKLGKALSWKLLQIEKYPSGRGLLKW